MSIINQKEINTLKASFKDLLEAQKNFSSSLKEEITSLKNIVTKIK